MASKILKDLNLTITLPSGDRVHGKVVRDFLNINEYSSYVDFAHSDVTVPLGTPEINIPFKNEDGEQHDLDDIYDGSLINELITGGLNEGDTENKFDFDLAFKIEPDPKQENDPDFEFSLEDTPIYMVQLLSQLTSIDGGNINNSIMTADPLIKAMLEDKFRGKFAFRKFVASDITDYSLLTDLIRQVDDQPIAVLIRAAAMIIRDRSGIDKDTGIHNFSNDIEKELYFLPTEVRRAVYGAQIDSDINVAKHIQRRLKFNPSLKTILNPYIPLAIKENLIVIEPHEAPAHVPMFSLGSTVSDSEFIIQINGNDIPGKIYQQATPFYNELKTEALVFISDEKDGKTIVIKNPIIQAIFEQRERELQNQRLIDPPNIDFNNNPKLM